MDGTRIIWIVLLWGGMMQIGWAQNLVMNPSFEEYQGVNFVHIKRSMTQGALHWGTPNLGYSDYFSTRNRIGRAANRNPFGSQAPHSGAAYAGICIHHDPPLHPHSGSHPLQSEYLLGKLTQSLQADSLYCVTLYLSLGDEVPDQLAKLGMHFSEQKVWVAKPNRLPKQYAPQLEFTELEHINTYEWTQICGIYQAKGGEQFITFGNFESHQRINTHYHIDDVSVRPMKNPTDCECAVIEEEEPGVVSEFTKNQVLILENVLFHTDEYEILPASDSSLMEVVQIMQEHPKMRIEIRGHTDSRDTEAWNQWLSNARSRAVVLYLVGKGISMSRMEWKGFGESLPIADNETEIGRQLNRRVEMRILSVE